MKKTLLLGALALLGASFSASAEIKSPYNEGFDNPGYRPKGWLHACSSSYAAGTYTVNTTGGHTNGYISVNQYGNYWSSYYGNYSYNDYLITPAVSGEVSIWVKKNGTDPTLSFHKVADISGSVPSSGYPILDGTAQNIVKDRSLDDWTKVTVTGVPDGTYIAVRAHNLSLDDFSASIADVKYRASILADVSNTTGSTTLEANEQNNVTIKFKVTLENNGDIDYPASATGFRVDLKNSNLDEIVGTGYVTDAIPFGVKVEKEFTMEFPAKLAPNTVSNSFRVVISNNEAGSVEASLAYFTIIPYAPVAKFIFNEDNTKNQSNYNDVNILETITIGAGPAGTGRMLYLWNSGTAPMVVKNTTVTGDFSCNAGAFTLARDEKKEIAIAVKGNPGRKEGKITFQIEGLGDVTYDLLGLVTKQGDYMEDFEGPEIPAGFIPGKNWSLVKTPETLSTLGGTQWIACTSTYSPDRLILPKLTFENGENFNFMATKTDNTSSVLNVYTSNDRVEWKLVGTVDTRNEDAAYKFSSDKPTGTGYGTYEFKIFSFPMTAGDTYIALEAGGARVDNICGGKLTPVEHDIYVSKIGIPDDAMVNTRYIVSMTAQNLLVNTEKNYDIVLEMAGEVVAHASETPNMKTNDPINFDIRFTPHNTGKYESAIVFVSGDFRMPLSEFVIDVQPEKAEATYQVGDAKITTTDPFNTFYDGSQCQIIYRKNDLDLAPGMKIMGTTFNGYATDACKKHVKVYAMNTDIDRFDFGYKYSNITPMSPDDMTLVYEGDYQFKAGGNNSTKEYVPMFDIDFNTPFEYAGKNICFMYDIRDIEGEGDGKHVFVTVDNSVYDYWNDIYDDRVITQKKEFQEDLDDEPSWGGYNAGFPVTYFKVAKDVVVVRGLVTDDFDKPVKDVKVKFESDDLLYSTTSNANGEYFISVGNLDHVFTLSVDSDEFSPVAVNNVKLDPKQQAEFVHNFKLAYVDRSAVLSGQVFNTLDDDEPLEGVTVTLTQGDIKVDATTDKDGAYTITVPKFTGEYTLTVSDGGTPFYTSTYTFKSKADKLDIDVEFSGISDVKVSDDVKVAVSGNVVTVYAPAGTTVYLYSTDGVLYGSHVSDGEPMKFESIPAGIYIVAGHKIVVR